VDGFAGLDYSHVGSSVSGTTVWSGGTPIRPAYNIVNGRLGTRWDKWEVAIFAKNLFNARPNLGDLNPLSYPRILPNGDPDPRVALLQPLTVGVQMRVEF
jgi:hypothetical protein